MHDGEKRPTSLGELSAPQRKGSCFLSPLGGASWEQKGHSASGAVIGPGASLMSTCGRQKGQSLGPPMQGEHLDPGPWTGWGGEREGKPDSVSEPAAGCEGRTSTSGLEHLGLWRMYLDRGASQPGSAREGTMSAGLAPREQAVSTIAQWRPMEGVGDERAWPRQSRFWYGVPAAVLCRPQGGYFEALLQSLCPGGLAFAALRHHGRLCDSSNRKYLCRQVLPMRYFHQRAFDLWPGSGTPAYPGPRHGVSLHSPVFPCFHTVASLSPRHWNTGTGTSTRPERPKLAFFQCPRACTTAAPIPGPRGRWAASSRSW